MKQEHQNKILVDIVENQLIEACKSVDYGEVKLTFKIHNNEIVSYDLSQNINVRFTLTK